MKLKFAKYILNIRNERWESLVGLIIQIKTVIKIHSESQFVYNILTYIRNTTLVVCYINPTNGPNTIA